MITNHTKLLNALISKYSLKSYLEIGVQNPANNFDKIKCPIRVGVDPELQPINKCEFSGNNFSVGPWESYKLVYQIHALGSDEYFKDWTNIFDLIFIDGLHHADQVKRDFENSLRCLSDNGFIVIHDVLPENEEGTIVPRQTKQWWGDVYKWAMNVMKYPGINFKTFNIDNGCMLVWREPGAHMRADMFQEAAESWDNYIKAGKLLMRVTNEVDI